LPRTWWENWARSLLPEDARIRLSGRRILRSLRPSGHGSSRSPSIGRRVQHRIRAEKKLKYGSALLVGRSASLIQKSESAVEQSEGGSPMVRMIIFASDDAAEVLPRIGMRLADGKVVCPDGTQCHNSSTDPWSESIFRSLPRRSGWCGRTWFWGSSRLHPSPFPPETDRDNDGMPSGCGYPLAGGSSGCRPTSA
jgi:hypothetical protein